MAILDKGLDLTLRPMKYPEFYKMYIDAIKNTWSVDEVDFSIDKMDLRNKITPSERHMIQRLVAFFATGDAIVSDNLVINLYTNINSPEARMYLSRQLFEEAQHIQFYLTLLDTYIEDDNERAEAFAAIENIPSLKLKADFCFQWMKIEVDSLNVSSREFLLTLICFAACVEGIFFYGAFVYVYFLRSKGLLPGLAAGTDWVFRDESCHMNFAFEVVDTIRREEPELFGGLEPRIINMINDAILCEEAFAEDMLQYGIAGLSLADMKQYLRYVGDQRLQRLGYAKRYQARNPFAFMEAQDVQELANFFERRSTAYQSTVSGSVDLNASF